LFVISSSLSDEKAQDSFFANTPPVVQDKSQNRAAHGDRREPAIAALASAKAQAVNAQVDGDSDHHPLAQYEEGVIAIGLNRPPQRGGSGSLRCTARPPVIPASEARQRRARGRGGRADED
jgi:hypothetical protein